ncbi:RNA methyltransferase [Aeromonas media]|nr:MULTISPECIES: RNA methyltransferase [Aeromonas]
MTTANGCMNLAASVNVILYDRLAKTLRAEG